MNRKQRRDMARAVVRRGGASEEVTREARRAYAHGIRQARKVKEVQERAEVQGLEIARPRLWTPGDK